MMEEETIDAQSFHRALEVDVLARTIWGEAKGGGSAVMIGVAQVVRNRVRAGQGWWGRTVIQTCQKPHQFRCWDAGGPLHRKILRVDSKNRHFAAAMEIANQILQDNFAKDLTGGATHYHRAGEIPEWAATRAPTAEINGFIFYQFLDL